MSSDSRLADSLAGLLVGRLAGLLAVRLAGLLVVVWLLVWLAV